MIAALVTYLYWHYTTALERLMDHIEDAFTFLWRFFAIPMLLKTLLAPWRRMGETYSQGFNLKDAISTFIVNMLMRLVGLVVRLVVIGVGIGVLIAAGVISLVAALIWATLPIVVGVIIGIIVSLLTS